MLTDDELYTRTYRQAARRSHPDTGDHADAATFRRLTEARDLLEAHRG
jgi:curved DNA-binding protein CbpA